MKFGLGGGKSAAVGEGNAGCEKNRIVRTMDEAASHVNFLQRLFAQQRYIKDYHLQFYRVQVHCPDLRDVNRIVQSLICSSVIRCGHADNQREQYPTIINISKGNKTLHSEGTGAKPTQTKLNGRDKDQRDRIEAS